MDYTKLSINEIKDIAGKSDLNEKKKLIELLECDSRTGVINIIKRLQSEIEAFDREMERLREIKRFERLYNDKGAKYIAGIDEVGRGPLAGPVYASAVIFPIDCLIEGVNDSKKLSHNQRENLYDSIRDSALCHATGWCDEKTIDEVNILNATYMAMRQAIDKLSIKPQVLLIDAVRIPGVNIFQVPIVKGDTLSFSIAAASIIAKVQRDRVMDELHNEYPVYNFASNKGYGSKEHIDAIKEHGPCPIHRKTFIKGIMGI